jgi:hypothetical protein
MVSIGITSEYVNYKRRGVDSIVSISKCSDLLFLDKKLEPFLNVAIKFINYLTKGF